MKKGVVIHHNGPQANCVGQPHSRCERFWNGVRDYHMNHHGWSDIAYSFGACPHGTLFVGRGWHKNQFANGSDQVGVDDGRDRDWYTVLAFVGGGEYGGFDTGEPEEPVTFAMEKAIVDLVLGGRRKGFCGRRVLPHNAFKYKACPARTLTELAIRLDHGAATPSITNVEDNDMATVLAHFRTTAGSDRNMHTYRVSGGLASWCGTHDEIAAAQFLGATWVGPLDPHVWQSLAVFNGPLVNGDRR